MRSNVQLDVDIVTIESRDEVSAIVELVVPIRDRLRRLGAATHVVVLDHSSSMDDGRLETAKDGLEAFIDQLDPRDNFGLVTFDGSVEVVVPVGPVRRKETLKRAVRGVELGTMTNLSGGLLRGIQEARRVMGGQGAKLTLISDGLANVGIVSIGDLERIVAGAHGLGIETTTMRIGSGCDEELMAILARSGEGGVEAAHDPDTVCAMLGSHSDGLLEQVVQAASLTVRPTTAVEAIHVFDDLPIAEIEGGFIAELGDFCAGEHHRFVLKIDVPNMAALGLARICEMDFQWVDVADLVTHTVNSPVYVNVLPGDEAAGRVAQPRVQTDHALGGAAGAVPPDEDACLLFEMSSRARREADAEDLGYEADEAIFPEELGWPPPGAA